MKGKQKIYATMNTIKAKQYVNMIYYACSYLFHFLRGWESKNNTNFCIVLFCKIQLKDTCWIRCQFDNDFL